MDKKLFISLTLSLLALGSTTVTEFGKLLGSFPDRTQHDVAGNIYVIDENTIWVRGFSYDGTAPDAFFWAGTTQGPSSSGEIIPDESGTLVRLGRYNNENIMLTLPGGKTINDFKWISIWCRRFAANFGHVDVPSDFVAPAVAKLGPLGDSQNRVHDTYATEVIVLNNRQFQLVNLDYDGLGPAVFFWVDVGDTVTKQGKRVPHADDNGERLPQYNGATVIVTLPVGDFVTDYGSIGLWCENVEQNFGSVTIPSDLPLLPVYVDMIPITDNCKVLLEDRFHIAWTVDDANITLQFIGCVDIREYMAFGISGSDSRTVMVGSDVTVVYIDSNNAPMAVDYMLNDYAQCTPNNGLGACPDNLQGGIDNVELLHGFIRNGVTRITVERPLNSGDTEGDKEIPVDSPTYISWGIGDINPTGHVSKHDIRATGNVLMDFGATSTCPDINCLKQMDENFEAWKIEPMKLEPNSVVTARIGPSGGAKGYKGIAGQVGWGIAWYLNGSLIPEVQVTRNSTYTFLVYGGNDQDNLATYHPFYITSDKDGGYLQKPKREQEEEIIFAKPEVGDLCEYRTTFDPDSFDTFEAFNASLTLNCVGNPTPGKLTWFVEEDTPDVVYYQCYQHRFFGFKITVSGSSILGCQLPLLFLLLFIAIFNLS